MSVASPTRFNCMLNTTQQANCPHVPIWVRPRDGYERRMVGAGAQTTHDVMYGIGGAEEGCHMARLNSTFHNVQNG